MTPDVEDEFDVDVEVDVDKELIDDVMDAAAGRDRAEERLPPEHNAMVGFFKSMAGLRGKAAKQRASWLLSVPWYLKARLWIKAGRKLAQTCAALRK